MRTKDTGGVALITGSGRHRVGNVVARHLAERGYSIALHYHSSEKDAQITVRELSSKDIECEAFCANIAVETEVECLFENVLSRFGRLDVLVTTASIWSAVPLEKVKADDLWRDFNINTLGTFLTARLAGLAMCQQESGGVIVTMGDWAIERPYLDHSSYFVSKGAIPTLTRTLAVEFGTRNPRVRVNCIHPGPVMFPPDSSETDRKAMVESTLTKNPNCPRSIAQAVEFFVTNQFVTGVCMPVDGGRSIFSPDSVSRDRPI